MQLVFSIIIVAHFIACAWHKLALFEISNGMPLDTIWIGDEIHSDIFSRYVLSFYWTIITMITVGYGDISPISRDEKIFVIAITIVSSVIFAYNMN